jgi:DNA-binding MarR family transcriptional regulator
MTAHALRAVRDTTLEKKGIAFKLWVVMEALAEARDVDRERLIGRLVELGVHDRRSATQAIDQLHERGLIASTDQDIIELTAQGTALSEDIVATRRQLRDQLYGSIPREDIATTNRVLDTISERAKTAHAGLLTT